uniref:UDP-glucuronosyltransferase 40Q2 n=1 Tax=Spodoptera frugiperda TaxID=7108 RepID=A0A5Q0TYW5_SPOFR|nr:UDP-glucuronosyltransferase 40Q2 [Spodoptera frugiperda]
MNKWILIILSLAFLSNVCAYKILVAFAYPGKSHSILGEGYVRHLLEAGHEVTYITAHPYKKPHPNLRQILITSVIDKFEFAQSLDVTKMLAKEVDFKDMFGIYEVMVTIANRSLTHENVQKFMMDPNEKFDLVVAEWLYHHLYAGFATIFNCPYIWSSSLEPHPVVLDLIDEVGNPAYFPDHMSPISPPFSFTERVGELWNLIYLYRVLWFVRDTEEQAFRDSFGAAAAKRGITLPNLYDLKYNSSMMLANSHYSLGDPQRLPTNYVGIGGYHIQDEIPPLPKDLQKLMDSATDGVIYFSLGSMVRSETIPVELKTQLLNVFSKLKQTIIWKFDGELENVPKNVHIVKWAPQPSILAHPNAKIFITHGGLLSTTETIHYGVPIIGIPLFSDQFLNIKRAVRKGFALEVPLAYDTPAKLEVAIKEILSNPKYREKVKELSFIYHHRETKPGKTLVHWVEHVIQTKGAPHLQSPALHVPLYQKLYLDLVALIILGLMIVKRVLKALCCSKTQNKKKGEDKKKKRS